MPDKKNLLFYFSSNKRTNSVETLLLQLRNQGYNVMILTSCEKGDLHYFLEKNNFPIYTNVLKTTNGILFNFKQLLYLISFCKKNKIHYIHSHLQPANIIAVFANYFVSAKLLIFRHHFQYIQNSDYKEKINKREILYDKIINKLAPVIIVPSSGVYNGMLKYETVKKSKLYIIPYIYDFDKYKKPNTDNVLKLKNDYKCELRLIMVSRMVKLKRHILVFNAVKELIKEGLDIKLLVLDDGPEKNNLENFILENKLQDRIHMLGFKTDFIDYMACSELLIQPSLTDASNSAVKEMALSGKLVAVSEEVGDYSDYIIDNQNGFLIPLHNSKYHVIKIIKQVYNNKDNFNKLGVELKKDVLNKFDIKNSENVILKYLELMK